MSRAYIRREDVDNRTVLQLAAKHRGVLEEPYLHGGSHESRPYFIFENRTDALNFEGELGSYTAWNIGCEVVEES
jgi:hypothetical protein